MVQKGQERIPTLDEHPNMPDKDPMRIFWMELDAEQKKFIEARVLTETDQDAVAWAKTDHTKLARWKRYHKGFIRVYNALVRDIDETARILFRNRLMLLSGSALQTLDDYLAMSPEFVTKNATEQARVAKDIIVELAKAAPRERGRPPAEPKQKFEPLVFDPEELTAEAMARGEDDAT